MPKIFQACIYSPSENIWGGGQVYIENLCRYMNDNNLRCFIATSEPKTFNCPTVKIPSVTSKHKRLVNSFRVAIKLKRAGIKFIVLNDLSSLWLAPIFKASGLKVIALLHMYLQKVNSAGLGYSNIEYHLIRNSSYFCDKIFTVNKENLDIFPVQMEFVGNFISPWFFGQSEDPKTYDLGIISRLSREKNIPLFIDLIKNLNVISPYPVKALIVGRGEEKHVIEKSIRENGLQDLIDLQEWVDRKNLPKVYDSIKCFAITSYHEGFATTLLEAHARGVPAISTKSAGFCPEFIEGYGTKTGLSFDIEDVSSLAFQKTVLDLIKNSDSYRDNCIRKAQLFTEDKVLGKIYNGIKPLLNNNT